MADFLFLCSNFLVSLDQMFFYTMFLTAIYRPSSVCLWCLMLLSTIFQLYRGGPSSYWLIFQVVQTALFLLVTQV